MSSCLESIIKQFEYYKLLGDKTFEQLHGDEINWQFNDESNSIAIIVKHIAGNMLSRWTNFLTEDGEKEWRHRDTEFEDAYTSKEDMLEAWEKGWQCLLDAIKHLTEKDLECIIYIRNQGHTVIEAINRQLSHYPFHVCQIVFVGKMIKGKKWQSLSVPKRESEAFNKEKFNKEKGNRHFTDDL